MSSNLNRTSVALILLLVCTNLVTGAFLYGATQEAKAKEEYIVVQHDAFNSLWDQLNATQQLLLTTSGCANALDSAKILYVQQWQEMSNTGSMNHGMTRQLEFLPVEDHHLYANDTLLILLEDPFTLKPLSTGYITVWAIQGNDMHVIWKSGSGLVRVPEEGYYAFWLTNTVPNMAYWARVVVLLIPAGCPIAS